MRNDGRPRSLGRRRFLSDVGKTGAVIAGVSLFPGSIQKALAIPAARSDGTIHDVQHVVILMQENRSFDHYFGTLAGVRGFGDKTAIPLPNGKPVWYQSDGDKEILPFHLDTQTTTAMRVPGTPHSWSDAQQAWDQGRLGHWPKYKQFQSMGYYEPADVPFQRALAEAFTICDAHHCSIQTGTLANRVVFMTGTNVTPGLTTPATSQSQALIDNANNRGTQFGPYGWTTYPERLQAAGVSWRIYQDPQDNWGGLLAPWESFVQYQNARSGEPLFENAMTRWSLDDLQDHVSDATLPQVSWIIPTPVWSEHPSASSPLQGAGYTQQVLDILVSNPEVWSKTVFIVTFDENDGLFDHVPPPAVPSYNPDGSLAGKATLTGALGQQYFSNEIDGVLATRPYGLGPRVPLYVVSPWSKGGWVCSQVFDHTSTIRFLEARFGVAEPNISDWHRAISGDLTRCFDFADPDSATVSLPDMSAAKGETLRLDGAAVALPDPQALPQQATGMRYSRALPYVLNLHSRVSASALELRFENQGTAGAVFHVYDRLRLDLLPRRYTVEAGKESSDAWLAADGGLAYDLLVIGPNGFLRELRGEAAGATHLRALPELRLEYAPDQDRLRLRGWNDGAIPCVLHVSDNIYPECELLERWHLSHLFPTSHHWQIDRSANWYDFTIRSESCPSWSRRFAGRMENGRDGLSDPAAGLRRS
jgi:phospholipase C